MKSSGAKLFKFLDDFFFRQVCEHLHFFELEDVLQECLGVHALDSSVRVNQTLALGVNEDVTDWICHNIVCVE